MSLVLVSSPIKTIKSILSNVSGVLSQLPYSFKRTDYFTSGYEDSAIAGNQVVIIDASFGDLTSEILNGDTIYIFGNSILLDDSYPVLAVTWDLTNTKIELNFPFLTAAAEVNDVNLTSGLRADYRVYLRVVNADNTALLLNIILKYQTKPSGELFVDLRDAILPLMIGELDLTYDVQFSEFYDGIEQSGTTLIGNVQAIKSLSQAADVGGSNEWDLLGVRGSEAPITKIAQVEDNGGLTTVVVFTGASAFSVGDIIAVTTADNTYINSIGVITSISGESTIETDIVFRGAGSRGQIQAHLGRILTRFINPLVWEGWTRTLTTIKDSNFTTRTGGAGVLFTFSPRNINKNPTGGIGFNSPADVDVGISEAIIPETQKIDGAPAFVRAVIRTSQLITVSNELFYRVEQECQRPVYVEWVNSFGGREQHLFSIAQDVSKDTLIAVPFNSPINEDLEFAVNTLNRRVIDTKQRVTVVAENLLIDQYRALSEIKFSDNVFVYLAKDGSSLIRVRVTKLTGINYGTKPRGAAWSITIELEMPDNFDLFDVLNLSLPSQRPAAVIDNLIDSDLDDLIDLDTDNLIG